MFGDSENYERVLKPGEVLFKENDVGDEMYFIRKGKIKIFKEINGNERVLAVLSEGDFFGEMAVIDGSARSASAAAVEETELIIIDKDRFMEQINENPLIGYVIETLTKRLRNCDERIKFMSIKNDEQRTLRFILGVAKTEGKEQNGMILLQGVTPEKIHNLTDVPVEKITEYLKRLSDIDIITEDDNNIYVKNIRRLEEYVEYVELKEKFKGL